MNTQPNIVAVIPFWSQSESINTDSNYRFLQRVLPRLASLYPDWLWFVWWPQASKGGGKWGYVEEGLFRTPNIHRFPWGYDTAVNSGVLAWDPDRFRIFDLNFSPCTYWLQQIESGAQISGGFKDSVAIASKPAIVSQLWYPIHKSLPGGFNSLFPRLWGQLGGLLASNRIIAPAHYTKKMTEETAALFLTQEKCEDIKKKTSVLHWGLVEDEWTKLPINPGPGKPVFIWNSRFERYKRYDITADVLEDLRTRHDFEVWVAHGGSTRLSGDFPADKVIDGTDHSVYLNSIAVPGINTINTVYETFCIAVLDSIMLGQLPVAPNNLTFPELVPPGYPFLFNSKAEQTKMLDHILTTWPLEYDKWCPVLRAHATNTFGIEKYAQDWGNILADVSDIWKTSTAKDHVKVGLQKYFGRLKPGEYSLRRIWIEVQKATGLGNQALPMRRVFREAGALGNMKPVFDGREVLIEWRGLKK